MQTIDLEFDRWNGIKKDVNKKPTNKSLFFHEREVWWVNLGLNVGVEANGKNEIFERPVLVVKKFNSEMFWAIPVTSKEKLGEYYLKVNYEGGFSFANIGQLKVISTKRLNRKIGVINQKDFELVIEKLQKTLETSKPAFAGFSEAEATNTLSLTNPENLSSTDIDVLINSNLPNKYFRVEVDGVGIYEAVDKFCPKDDERRKNKPDGSWLIKAGPNFPSSKSFWTERGFRKYVDSGLFLWHTNVIKGTIEIKILDNKPGHILYQDDLQIII